jgi:hypothetical protein
MFKVISTLWKRAVQISYSSEHINLGTIGTRTCILKTSLIRGIKTYLSITEYNA